MSKEFSDNALDGQVGNHFFYQQFESDGFSRTEHQQRWKLLESIANQAPQAHQASRELQKAASPYSTVTEPAYHLQQALKESSLSMPVTSVEPVQRTSSLGGSDVSTQRPVVSQGAHFGHLFKAYSENGGEPEQSDPKQASLKSLLRQINS